MLGAFLDFTPKPNTPNFLSFGFNVIPASYWLTSGCPFTPPHALIESTKPRALCFNVGNENTNLSGLMLDILFMMFCVEENPFSGSYQKLETDITVIQGRSKDTEDVGRWRQMISWDFGVVTHTLTIGRTAERKKNIRRSVETEISYGIAGGYYSPRHIRTQTHMYGNAYTVYTHTVYIVHIHIYIFKH